MHTFSTVIQRHAVMCTAHKRYLPICASPLPTVFGLCEFYLHSVQDKFSGYHTLITFVVPWNPSLNLFHIFQSNITQSKYNIGRRYEGESKSTCNVFYKMLLSAQRIASAATAWTLCITVSSLNLNGQLLCHCSSINMATSLSVCIKE